MFFWCPCMAINNNVNVQYNGGFLPDIILWTQYYLHRGTCLNAMKRFCICNLLIPPKRFDIFSPITGGCSEGLGQVWSDFSLKKTQKNKAPDSQTSQATCQTKEIDRAHRSHSTREAKQNETNKKNQGSPIKTIKSRDSILVPLLGRGIVQNKYEANTQTPYEAPGTYSIT